MKKLLASILAVAMLLSVIGISSAVGAASTEMETVLFEDFNYTDQAAAKTALQKKFQIVEANADNTFGGSRFGISDGKLGLGMASSSFHAIRYGKALDGAYELSFDYKTAGAYKARSSGLGIILRNSLGESGSTLYEGYTNSNGPISQTGLVLYIAGSYANCSLHHATGTSISDFNMLFNDVTIGGKNAANGITLKITDDGNGNIDFYADDVLFASVSLSNIEEITLGSNTFKAYRNASCTYTYLGSGSKADRTNVTVAAENATFAFAKRGVADDSAYFDNVMVRQPKVNDGSVKITEDFDYDTQSAAESALRQNFDLYTANTDNAFGGSLFGISEGRLGIGMGSGSFHAIRYKNALDGKYEIEFDYQVTGGWVARASGIGILIRNSLGEAGSSLYEGYTNSNAPISQTGLVLYIGGTYASVFVHHSTSTSVNDFNSLVSDAKLGVDSTNGVVTIKIVDDGEGTIDFFANSTKFMTIELSDIQEITLGSNTFKAYRSASCTYVTNGTEATRVDRTNVTVAAENSTFAIAKRGIANNTAYFDNLEIIKKAEKKTGIDFAQPILTDTIAMDYGATVLEDAESVQMRFTFKGEETLVDGVAGDDNAYTFTLPEILPQEMGENIKAELIVDGEVVDTKDEYSIKEYCMNQLENAEGELRTLLIAMLNYGAAAQVYFDEAADGLVNKDITDVFSSFDISEAKGVIATPLSGTVNDSYKFKSAAIGLFDQVSVRFKFAASDLSKLTVEIGDKVYTAEDFTSAGTGLYCVEYADVLACEYAKPISAVIKVNGEPVGQTVTYSVNTYLKNKSESASVGEIVQAVYDYGYAAAAYVSAQAE